MARKLTPEQARDLGSRLRGARLGLSLTLEQLAATCGGDHTRVSKIERGKFVTLSKYVQSICTALHVAADSADDASPQALHSRLDQLIRRRPAAAPVIRAVLDALDRMAD